MGRIEEIYEGDEDLNKNGGVDSGEADPGAWDSDHDGLADGRVSFGGAWKGEDLNNNGVRDQDSEGEWNETDFLANDSDVDGVLDGSELWGRWCYKTESSQQCAGTNSSSRQLWVASPLKNGALIADFDGDGLRDGQEVAGWTVGVWYEWTMEKAWNRSVTSDPKDNDTDGDGIRDGTEYRGCADFDVDSKTDPIDTDAYENPAG